jgi:hypothetical protein
MAHPTYAVRLKSCPAKRVERVERIVHKHSANKLEHLARKALLHKVAAGEPQIVAHYAERASAENVVAEFALQGAEAEVVEPPKDAAA